MAVALTAMPTSTVTIPDEAIVVVFTAHGEPEVRMPPIQPL